MPKVEIYKLNNDGSQIVLATCRLVGSEVICEGDEVFVNNLKNEGIIDYSSAKRTKLYFKDGRKFLEQLKYNFKSGYLNASDVLNNSLEPKA